MSARLCMTCGLVGEHHEGCPEARWTSAGPNDRAVFEDDLLAQRIVSGFLLPACRYAPPEGKAWEPRDQWKPVNRAAGAIAGWLFSLDPEHVDRLRMAQHLVDDCRVRLKAESEKAAFREQIGVGLAKRVAECLLALGVES